jgi:hypothetical protein
VRFSVTANPDQASRSGTISVGGQQITVTQAGGAPPVPCTYTLTPTSIAVGYQGGSQTVDVKAAAGCAWSAAGDQPWITVVQGSGSGDGVLRFDVGENSLTAPRTGRITVAGQAVTVTQSGALGQTITLAGTVADLRGTCPTLEFTVLGRVVRTDAVTTFPGPGCRWIRNGRNVAVRGTVQDGNWILAQTIIAVE